MFEEVLALSRKALGPEDPGTVWAMHQLAYVNFNSGHQDGALVMRENVLALFRKLFGAEHPDTHSAMHGLASSYAAAGRQDEALKMREMVLALQRKVLGPEHPDTFWTMTDISALALQPDGKVLIGGSSVIVGAEHVLPLSRLNADGSRDTSFDSGKGLDRAVSQLALQPDGRVLIGGPLVVGDHFFGPAGDVLIGGDFITVNGVMRR